MTNEPVKIAERTLGPGSWWAVPPHDPMGYPIFSSVTAPNIYYRVRGRLERYLDGWVLR